MKPTMTEKSSQVAPSGKLANVFGVAKIYSLLRREDVPLLSCAFGSTLIAGAAPVANTLIVSELFKQFTRYQNGEYSSLHSYLKTLQLDCLLIGLAGLILTTTSFAQTFIFSILAERQQIRCRKNLYRSLTRRSFDWYEDGSQDLNGELIQLNRSVEEYRAAVGEFSAVFLRCICTVATLTVTSFILCWRLTLLAFVSVPLVFLIFRFAGKRVDFWAKEEDSRTSKAAAVLDWNLRCFLWVKTVFTQQIELDKFKRRLEDNKKAYNRFNLYSSGAISLMTILSLMLFVQSFWFGSYIVRRRYNSPNEVISAFYACLNIALNSSSLSALTVTFQKGYASFQKVLKFADFTETQKDTNEIIPDIRDWQISFSHVDFKYKSRDDAVLKDVSFKMNDGGWYFVIGTSGSGKSTLASLVLKLYDLESGKIRVGGYNLHDIDRFWLRSKITFVQQFSPIFTGTIRENILLGDPSLLEASHSWSSEVSLNRALKFACLEELVEALPKGVDTPIGSGEGGFEPSGGEKQRIALARAFLRDSEVMILDESLSAIDIALKRKILENLRRYRRLKTTILITHDMSEIKRGDCVLKMEQGKLVDTFISDGSTAAATKRKKSVRFEKVTEKLTQVDDLEDQTEKAKKGTFKLVFKLLKSFLLARYRVVYGLGVFLAIAKAVLTPLFSFCFSKLITGILPTAGHLTSQRYQTKWSLILTAIAILEGVCHFLSKVATGLTAERLVENVRAAGLDKILRQDLKWLQECDKTETSTLLLNDSRDLRNVFEGCIDAIMGGLVMLLLGIIWATITGWKLALVGLSLFPLFAAIAIVCSKFTKSSENTYKEAVLEGEKLMGETVSGIKTVVCLNLQDHFSRQFDDKLAVMKKEGFRRAGAFSFSLSMTPALVNMAQAIVFYYGLKLVIIGEYNLVQTMQVYFLVIFSVSSSTSMLGSLPHFYRGMRVAGKIDDILEQKEDLTQLTGYLEPVLVGSRDTFHLQNVSFKYSETSVLSGLSLKIPRNKITCLVGHSGCGKSTILSLLMRLYPVQSGEISMNGVKLSSINLGMLRRSIAVVPQNHNFIDGTIRENLMYGNPFVERVDDYEIWKALSSVHLEHFVLSLKDGLNTRMGGDAKTMLVSGGQAQRLCIARALLRGNRVLLLDECTSSLDKENTHKVLELLHKLKSACTIVLVTHSREVMEAADEICMIKDGRVAEHGTFKELLQRKGDFYGLVN